MCGILGGNCVEWDYEKGILSMKHRGPDGQRVVKFKNFVLAFARLAIQDLSEKAMQPMFSSNEDVCIVFNGEIYGYQNLKASLIKKGYVFKTTSDTEVILNAYLEYKDRFIDYIDGMFAIAIYDLNTEKIKLFRDRTGIKPLYYYYDGNYFGFASELKGITSMYSNKQFAIDYTAVYDYLSYQYIPEPKSLYKNIYKLRPAHKLVFNVRKRKIESDLSYWKLNINTNQKGNRKKSDVEEEARYLIHKSIKEQLISDVPVGSFLSGGIDSSIVSYEIFKEKPEIECFSMGFQEEKYDETKYAKMLLNQYAIHGNIEYMSKTDFNEIYHLLPQWYDEPFADTTAYANYKISEAAKNKVTVILTGDGGDEVFGGYVRYETIIRYLKKRKYHTEKFSKLYEQLISKNFTYLQETDKLFAEDLLIYGFQNGQLRKFDGKAFAKRWSIDKDYDEQWFFRKHYKKDLPLMTRFQYLDLKTYLPGAILTKVDRTAMQVSLETRVPFLSREIIEFSFGLAEEDRCPGGVLKGLLKNAYKNIIPDEILFRKKKGFTVPPNYYQNRSDYRERFLKELWNLK